MTIEHSPPLPDACPPRAHVPPAPSGLHATQTAAEVQAAEAASSAPRFHPVVEQHVQWFEMAMDAPCL